VYICFKEKARFKGTLTPSSGTRVFHMYFICLHAYFICLHAYSICLHAYFIYPHAYFVCLHGLAQVAVQGGLQASEVGVQGGLQASEVGVQGELQVIPCNKSHYGLHLDT